MTSTTAYRAPLALRTAWCITEAAAWAVSLVRPLIFNKLSDDGCEAEGKPHGSTARAVFTFAMKGQPWWVLYVWLDREDPREHCLCARVLGHYIEVFYHPRELAAQAL